MNKPIDLNTEGLIYGLDRLIVRGGVGYSRIYLELVPLFIIYVIYLLMSKVFGIKEPFILGHYGLWKMYVVCV